MDTTDLEVDLLEELKKLAVDIDFTFDDVAIFANLREFIDGCSMNLMTFQPQNMILNILESKEQLITFLENIGYLSKNRDFPEFQKGINKILANNKLDEKSLKKIIFYTILYLQTNQNTICNDASLKDNIIIKDLYSYLNILENGKYITFQNPLYDKEKLPLEVLKETIFSDKSSFSQREKMIIYSILEKKYNLPDLYKH